MTVKELIDSLKKMPPNAPVDVAAFFVGYNHGEVSDIVDICRNGPAVQLNIEITTKPAHVRRKS